MSPDTGISTSPDDVVLTEPQVRKRLSLSKITLLRMRKRDDCGGLPYLQLSAGRIGYLDSDVRAFLVARRVGHVEAVAGRATIARFNENEGASPLCALPADNYGSEAEGGELGETGEFPG